MVKSLGIVGFGTGETYHGIETFIDTNTKELSSIYMDKDEEITKEEFKTISLLWCEKYKKILEVIK